MRSRVHGEAKDSLMRTDDQDAEEVEKARSRVQEGRKYAEESQPRQSRRSANLVSSGFLTYGNAPTPRAF